jgi:hypothetical protein
MRSISVLLALSAGAMFAQDRYERLMRDILIFDTNIDTPRYFVDEGYKLADEPGYYELGVEHAIDETRRSTRARLYTVPSR